CARIRGIDYYGCGYMGQW
nr:immunoglobulin heavy chain junction region [Macaca mulatta]MOV92008.1 immunoglobulin heavy chain junction region [Macaca mulatta]